MSIEFNPELEVESFGVQTVFERARFADRFFANIVDGVIVVTPLRLLLFALTTFLHSSYVPLLNLIIFLFVYLWYFSYFPYKNNGQTLGKKWLKMRIANLDGNNLSLGHFVARDIVKNGTVFIATIFFGNYGMLWLVTYLIALTKDRRALHDIIARTQVIKAENVALSRGK